MSNDNSDQEIMAKAKEIEEKLNKFRKETTADDGPTQNIPNDDELKGSRAGSEFLANVIAGGLIGYGIDWWLSSAPWGMIAFIILGFVSGVYRANAAMKENSEKNDN